MAKDFSKLIGRIYEKFGTRKAFCDAIEKAPEWLSRRLNGQTEFNADDMMLVIDALGIDPQDIHVYFLSPNVL